jgi:hypothetical protein
MATQPLFPTEDDWNTFQERYLPISIPPGKPSPFAELIENGRYNDGPLTQEMLGEIFARAIGGQKAGLGSAVLGHDGWTSLSARAAAGQPLNPADQLVADQTIIAPALDAAFKAGDIKIGDLKAVADAYGDDAGDQRVAALLGRHNGGPGGAAEAYALAMLEKHPLGDTPTTDSAVLDAQGLALSMLANDPQLRAAHFGDSPKYDPQVAFETLVAYNDQHPYRADDPLLAADQAANGVTAASGLYVEHGDTLLPHYTGLSSVEGSEPPQYTHNKDENSAILAKFFEQTVTNDDARKLVLEPGSCTNGNPSGAALSVIEAVGQKTADYAGTQFDEIVRVDASELGSDSKKHSIESILTGLGTLQGTLLVSSDLAMDKAKAAGENHDEAMGVIGAGANWIVSKIPLPGSGLAADALEKGIQSIPSGVPVPTTGDPKVLSDAMYGGLGELQTDVLSDPKRKNDSSPYFNWQDYFEKEVSEGRATVEGDLGSDKPTERYFEMSSVSPSQHSSLAMPGAETVRVASLTSPDHPDFARYAASLQGCEGCKLPIDEAQLANLASTVALRSREAGLPSVDHVVASPGGERVFAVAGRLDDPAHLRVSVPVDEARERSVETNSREWAELQRTRTAEVTYDAELTQRSAVRMA